MREGKKSSKRRGRGNLLLESKVGTNEAKRRRDQNPEAEKSNKGAKGNSSGRVRPNEHEVENDQDKGDDTKVRLGTKSVKQDWGKRRRRRGGGGGGARVTQEQGRQWQRHIASRLLHQASCRL